MFSADYTITSLWFNIKKTSMGVTAEVQNARKIVKLLYSISSVRIRTDGIDAMINIGLLRWIEQKLYRERTRQPRWIVWRGIGKWFDPLSEKFRRNSAAHEVLHVHVSERSHTWGLHINNKKTKIMPVTKTNGPCHQAFSRANEVDTITSPIMTMCCVIKSSF